MGNEQHWLIFQEAPEGSANWYVSRFPDIRFTQDKSEAVKFIQKDDLYQAIDSLTSIQANSFSKTPESFTIQCVK